MTYRQREDLKRWRQLRKQEILTRKFAFYGNTPQDGRFTEEAKRTFLGAAVRSSLRSLKEKLF